jgi:hypothetical protein
LSFFIILNCFWFFFGRLVEFHLCAHIVFEVEKILHWFISIKLALSLKAGFLTVVEDLKIVLGRDLNALTILIGFVKCLAYPASIVPKESAVVHHLHTARFQRGTSV